MAVFTIGTYLVLVYLDARVDGVGRGEAGEPRVEEVPGTQDPTAGLMSLFRCLPFELSGGAQGHNMPDVLLGLHCRATLLHGVAAELLVPGTNRGDTD